MKRTCLSFLVVVACSKGGTETVPLGDTGFVVDAPKGWAIESPMKGFYNFKHRGAPQIMEAPVAASKAEDIVKGHCEGRSDVKQETLPGGGVAVTCKGESKMIKGVTTTQIVVEIPKDDKSSLSCHLETDQDPADALAICKSIRKK